MHHMTTAMTEPGERPTEIPPRGDGRPSLQPLVVALFLGFGYMILCTVYILLSGKLAGELSSSLAELQRIEMFKGVTFVLVTGLVYFGFLAAWRLAVRLARHWKSPGVTLDLEAYNDYRVYQVPKVAELRGQSADEIIADCRALGAEMAAVVAALRSMPKT